MSYLHRTDVECSNREVVKACASAIRCISIDGNEEKFWDSETKLRCYTVNNCPHKEIIEVSKLFPDDVITCRHCFQSLDCSEAHVVEYRDGKDEYVDIKPVYEISSISNMPQEDENGILDKVCAFCRRLDTTEKDDDGSPYLTWVNEEVWYKFNYIGADGKKYKVDARKLMHRIDLNIYENFGKDDWREIINSTDPSDKVSIAFLRCEE